jgi:hypothetical protein
MIIERHEPVQVGIVRAICGECQEEMTRWPHTHNLDPRRTYQCPKCRRTEVSALIYPRLEYFSAEIDTGRTPSGSKWWPKGEDGFSDDDSSGPVPFSAI